MYEEVVTLRLLHSVWCARPVLVIVCLLTTATLSTDGAVVFTCHFKMETTALLRTFVLSLCSLPHHSQVYVHQNFCLTLHSLSLFFSLSAFSCFCFRTFRGIRVDFSIPLLAVKLN